MKKSYLYGLFGLLALTVSSCGTDPLDASEEYAYSQSENPYLRTDNTAVISADVSITPSSSRAISLDDYADLFVDKLGLTVDAVLQAIASGTVVCYPINTLKNIWERTAEGDATSGWYFNASGSVVSADSAISKVRLDTSRRVLVVDALDGADAGTTQTLNIGFAIDNGKNLNNYVRINITLNVIN